jgi:hypothetical protein
MPLDAPVTRAVPLAWVVVIFISSGWTFSVVAHRR